MSRHQSDTDGYRARAPFREFGRCDRRKFKYSVSYSARVTEKPRVVTVGGRYRSTHVGRLTTVGISRPFQVELDGPGSLQNGPNLAQGHPETIIARSSFKPK